MTGAELRAHRKAAGLTQIALAQRAGIGRHAVRYWEHRDGLDLRGWAVGRMLKALGMEAMRYFPHDNARAGGWGLTGFERMEASIRAEVARMMAIRRARELAKAARRRVVCGAKTRKGTPCRNKSEPGKRRCKFHGGKSTGPRTPEGRARIAEAQRRRWRDRT